MSKANEYTFLCNISDPKNSFVIKAINDEHDMLSERKENLIKTKVDINRELTKALGDLDILRKGNQQALDFLFSFDNNMELQNYLNLFGLNKDYFSDVRDVVCEENKTRSLEKELSARIDKLTEEKEKYEKDIAYCNEMLKYNEKDLNIVKSYTEDLGLLIDGALNNNGTFNRDYVNSLLLPIQEMATKYELKFPNDYLDACSKAIFFPSDGFDSVYKEYMAGRISYDDGERENAFVNKYEEIPVDSVVEEPVEEPVFEGPVQEETTFEEEPVSEEPVQEEELVQEDIDEPSEEDVELAPSMGENIEDIESSDEVVEDSVITDEEIVDDYGDEEEASPISELEKVIAVESSEDEPVEEDTVIDDGEGQDIKIAEMAVPEFEDLINTGSEESLQKYDISSDNHELAALIDGTNEDVVKLNLETLKALNVSDDVINYVNNGYSYLSDAELVGKINFLRGKYIDDKVIAESLKNHYIDCPFADIKNNVAVLEENGITFTKEYLVVIKDDVKAFVDALADLEKFGIEPDKKEIDQYLSLLTKYSSNIIPDTTVLKDYGVSLLRKNGKYELGIYTKSAYELQLSIDQIVETGEEDLVNNIPEVLAINSDEVVRRINYLKDHGIAYKEGSVYLKEIYEPMSFLLKYGDDINNLETLSDSNKYVSNKLNDPYCSLLIEILDRYYEKNKSYLNISLDPEQQGIIEEMLRRFEEEYGAVIIGKNTYKVGEMFVSMNKFIRNLKYLVCSLLSEGEDVMTKYNELIKVSFLYNMRKQVGRDIIIPGTVEVKDNGGKTI